MICIAFFNLIKIRFFLNLYWFGVVDDFGVEILLEPPPQSQAFLKKHRVEIRRDPRRKNGGDAAPDFCPQNAEPLPPCGVGNEAASDVAIDCGTAI